MQEEISRNAKRDGAEEGESKAQKAYVIEGRVINYAPQVMEQPEEGSRWQQKEEKIKRGWEKQTQGQERIKHLEGIVGNSYRQQSKLLDLVKGKDTWKGTRKRKVEEPEEEGIEQRYEYEDGKEGRQKAKLPSRNEETYWGNPSSEIQGKKEHRNREEEDAQKEGRRGC